MTAHKMKEHWRNCVQHGDGEVRDFVKSYFGDPHRRVFLMAGAGFDPRSTYVTELLASVLGDRISGIFLREERLGTPDPFLTSEAGKHTNVLQKLVPTCTVAKLHIFDTDGAVFLGTGMWELLNPIEWNEVTDVVLDVSAISSGVCFTLSRMLLEKCQQAHSHPNLHLFLSFHPGIDADIRTEDNDRVSTPKGFLKPNALADDKDKAKLWIPILSKRKQAALTRIRAEFPDDVDICPVLPFPAKDPGTGDRLAEAFQSEFEDSWDVDPRNIIYAAEDDPLDLYETILKLHDRREKAFGKLRGSQIILSPGGSKVLALGAMLAAIALDLPVLYVEDASYRLEDMGEMGQRSQESKMVHLWLFGDAYPSG